MYNNRCQREQGVGHFVQCPSQSSCLVGGGGHWRTYWMMGNRGVDVGVNCGGGWSNGQIECVFNLKNPISIWLLAPVLIEPVATRHIHNFIYRRKYIWMHIYRVLFCTSATKNRRKNSNLLKKINLPLLSFAYVSLNCMNKA